MTILFIQTGGTIDKDYPKHVSGYAFEIGESVVPDILKKWNPSFTFSTLSFCKKDSSEITDELRVNLAELISKREEKWIIITHGTDTIIQTAKAILQHVQNKRIILTGAMKPQKFSTSDADLNLGSAIGAIQYIDDGVYIAMHGLVKEVSSIQRNMDTGQFY